MQISQRNKKFYQTKANLFVNKIEQVIFQWRKSIMEKVVKKYKLKSREQEQDNLDFWQNQTIEFKLEILESLRMDAIKLGLYPDYKDGDQRLQRVLRIVKQKWS